MRFEMKMPDLATTDSEIRIARWLIETGQKIERGQPIVEVETDKATMEVESVVSGVLAEVRAAANEAVAVGQVIAVLEVEGRRPASRQRRPLQRSSRLRRSNTASPSSAKAAPLRGSTACSAAVARGCRHACRRRHASAAAAAAAMPQRRRHRRHRAERRRADRGQSGCRRASRRFRIFTCKPASTPRP